MNNENNDYQDVQINVVPEANIVHPAEFEPIPQAAHEPHNNRFAAMAPYWLNGLHNKAGLELAEKINNLIREKQLAENDNAIAAIIKTFPTAKTFGINIFAEEYYLADPWRKANPAEPVKLLNEQFVRDKEGAYRPATGGRPILFDEGDKLTIKDRKHGPKAVVEIAKAKGWTAINISGNKNTQEALWLEASFSGLTVVGYEPSKEAQAKLADMFAAEKADIEIKNKSIENGSFNGKILDVVDGFAIQKTGRDPDVTAKHKLSKLTRIPAKGDVVSIFYQNGFGQVSEKSIDKEASR